MIPNKRHFFYVDYSKWGVKLNLEHVFFTPPFKMVVSVRLLCFNYQFYFKKK